MSEQTLFIEIFQPFAQYRNPFTFYYAQTYPLPPKSTIMGMLQNAVGDWYGNGYKEKWQELKISIHGGFENFFWNYQNLIKGESKIQQKGNRYILVNQELPLYGEGLTSQRSPVYQQELFNGHLFILIKGVEDLISRIKDALERPDKVLYLGRSEDVVFIKRVKEVTANKYEIEGDIKLTYPTYILLDELPIKNSKYPVYSIPTSVRFLNGNKDVKHKSEISKETERRVEFKNVVYTGYNYSIILDKSISVESFEINNEKIKVVKGGWI